ncbi:MAG: phosphatase PAP2 family protein [Bacteroidota bacterium]
MPLVIGIGAGLGISQYAKRQVIELTPAEIALLDVNDVPGFDRKATTFWSPSADKWSVASTSLTMATPLILLADEEIRKDYQTLFLLSAETFLLTEMLTGITKAATKRSRPYLHNPAVNFDENLVLDRDARFSMFSRHTAQASAFTFLTAKIYSDHHPDSKLKPWIWTAAVVLPAVTGYLRYRSGENYPSDIITGYVVGAGIGLLIPTIHKKRNKTK